MTALEELGIRLVLYFALAIGVFAYGYVKGLHKGEADKEVFIAKQEVLGEKQLASNAQLLVKQKEINTNGTQENAKAIASLTQFYADKLRNKANTSGGKLSIATIRTEISNATTPEPTTCTTRDQAVSPLSAAKDSLTILQWQDWAVKQGFPIEK